MRTDRRSTWAWKTRESATRCPSSSRTTFAIICRQPRPALQERVRVRLRGGSLVKPLLRNKSESVAGADHQDQYSIRSKVRVCQVASALEGECYAGLTILSFHQSPYVRI